MKEKINWSNYCKKFLALVLVGVVSAGATYFCIAKGFASVDTGFVSDGKTYGTVKEIVIREVTDYLKTETSEITKSDLNELSEKIDAAIENTSGANLSDELKKEINGIVEGNVLGAKFVNEDDIKAAADSTGNAIESLMNKVAENERAYENLLNDYNKYKLQLTDKFADINSLIEQINNSASLSGTEAAQARGNLITQISGVAETLNEFMSSMDLKIAAIDADSLNDKNEYNTFLQAYNEYKASVNSSLNGINELIGSNSNNITALITQINALNDSFGNYKTTMDDFISSVNSKLNTLDLSVSNNAANISTLNNGMTNINTSLLSMQTSISSLEDNTNVVSMGNIIYPVGSIYISTSDVNPATIFGGTWEKISGKYIYAADDEKLAGSTGGSDSVLLDSSQIPSLTVNGSTQGTTTVASSSSTSVAYSNGRMRIVADGDAGGEIRCESTHIPGYTSGNFVDVDWSNNFSGANHFHNFNIPALTVNPAAVLAYYTNNAQTSVSISPTYISVNMWQRTSLG